MSRFKLVELYGAMLRVKHNYYADYAAMIYGHHQQHERRACARDSRNMQTAGMQHETNRGKAGTPWPRKR